ncbi:MAG: hypothetical protein WC875_00485 [Candidatus Absconditabacterales bacterium]
MPFLAPLIPSNRPEIVILIGLLLLGIGVLKISHRIRFILIIPVVAIIIFILGMFIVPLYQQGFDTEGFFRQQETKLIIIPYETSTAQIMIKPQGGTPQRLSTQKAIQQIIQGFEGTQISFISQDTGEKAECFIQIPNGMLVQIFPQSALLLSGKYPNIEISTLQGTITYTSGNISQANILIKGLHIDTQMNTYKNMLITAFEEKKKEYLGRGLSGLSENATINKLSKRYLDVLSSLSPSKYAKNVINYSEAQKYIDIPATVEKIVDPNTSKDILQQATKGRQETKLYKWRQQLTQ